MSKKQLEKDGKIPLLILGVHARDEGYPNILYRLLMLTNDERLNVSEINYPLAPRRHFQQSRSAVISIIKKAGTLIKGIAAHIAVVGNFIISGKHHAVYVPYPAPGVLFLLSMLPRSLRPGPLYCDAFISLYDTIITDRRLIKENSFRAVLLKHFEKRAYSICSHVCVDTEENKRYYAELFGLPEDRFVPLPLATNEKDYLPCPYKPKMERCKVLFVGTFVPLQGIGTIAQAIGLLVNEKNIEFVIIGNGQEADKLELLLKKEPLAKVQWIRAWQDAETIAANIAEADICLGIFAAGDKAQRVWPYKNYLYMSVGRAIITGETKRATAMLKQAGTLKPFLMVPVNNPQALAKTILKLADNPEQRKELAKKTRNFYTEHLANEHSHAELFRMIAE